MLTPTPLTNVARDAPDELPTPVDPPMLFAADVREVITAAGCRRLRAYQRREQRMWRLAANGDWRAARRARPEDLTLDWERHTRPAFRGVVMDFSQRPYRSLLPTRWPDRPPSTDLHIRAIRREFRSHPSFPNRQLRGVISHGDPAWNECRRICHLAGPHTSALRHFDLFDAKAKAERDSGWAEAGFPDSFECASWPVRRVPSSIAFRDRDTLSGARLCTDLSWPQPLMAPGVDSPNDAQKQAVAAARFARLGEFCVACAVRLPAGVPVRVWKVDLVAAYKRSGQQRATRWYRQYSTSRGAQTLDRISFGQTDGPSSFTEQSNFIHFVITREMRYADECYPTRDAAIIAWTVARRGLSSVAGDGTEGPSLADSLSFLFVLLDDFGGVSFCDPLWRADGSPVLEPSGRQLTRAELHFRIAVAVIRRFGHDVDPSKPEKYAPPCLRMIILGGVIDVGPAESLSLEPAKRERYLAHLRTALERPAPRTSGVTSLAFKMLVVCEVYPRARQWLHAVFRCLRRHRECAVVDWSQEPEARDEFGRFAELLRSDERLEIPLACRRSFPMDGHPSLIVKYDDASGENHPWERASNAPGFGAWSVRDGCLYYVHGLWTRDERATFSITVLEYLISIFSTDAFSSLFPDASHLLEFTDNTGVEWSARRENASAELMQRLTARRSQLLAERRLTPRTVRVRSADNLWADMLSRQRVDDVLQQAHALGLRTQLVALTPATRDTDWLLAHARRDP
jgi:hypothetical protein